MRRLHVLWLLLIAATVLTSCANSGAFMASHQTSVELGEKNYEIIAHSVTGESTVAYLFGGSFSIGNISRIDGLIRVDGTGEIYSEALNDLWLNFEDEFGSAKGESVALANIRYDSETINVFFYTQLDLTVRADVVRFTE